MENANRPIGLFDSGVGGTSIWKEIHAVLPNEDTIYLADSKNAPYGLKTKEEIIELSIKNTEYLLNLNCKIIVVACNTATTNAIKFLRVKYPEVPFIGIEPAIKPAATSTQTQTIGILATKGTLNSELFHKTVSGFSDIKIMEQVGYNLVTLIEGGKLNSDETKELLKKYLNPMVEANIDYLVLGCSHYPFLIPQIREILPSHVKIIDSGQAVAKQTKAVLEKTGLVNKIPHTAIINFYTNSDPSVLNFILKGEHPIDRRDF